MMPRMWAACWALLVTLSRLCLAPEPAGPPVVAEVEGVAVVATVIEIVRLLGLAWLFMLRWTPWYCDRPRHHCRFSSYLFTDAVTLLDLTPERLGYTCTVCHTAVVVVTLAQIACCSLMR
jgi:hypothetical protein